MQTEIDRLAAENEDLRRQIHDLRILYGRQTLEFEETRDKAPSYATGLEDLEKLDFDLGEFRSQIIVTVEAMRNDCDKLSMRFRQIDDREDLSGGGESTERRRYVCRKEALHRKIQDIQRGFDLLCMIVECPTDSAGSKRRR